MAKKIYNGLDLVNQRIVNVGSPSLATDAANKQYVDNLVNGLNWKAAVDVATTSNGTLASAYAAGQVIDGMTLLTGWRILIKNQTTQADNGIYVVQASGAPQRAGDAGTGGLVSSTTVRVNQGTVNADSAWTLTTDGTITVGTTNQTWARSDSGTPYAAGNGLGLSSNIFSVTPGAGIIADGTSTRIDPSVVARKYSQTIGNGSASTIAVTHSLSSTAVHVMLYDSTSKAVVDTDVAITDANTITLSFASAPATGAITVVVIG